MTVLRPCPERCGGSEESKLRLMVRGPARGAWPATRSPVAYGAPHHKRWLSFVGPPTRRPVTAAAGSPASNPTVGRGRVRRGPRHAARSHVSSPAVLLCRDPPCGPTPPCGLRLRGRRLRGRRLRGRRPVGPVHSARPSSRAHGALQCAASAGHSGWTAHTW